MKAALRLLLVLLVALPVTTYGVAAASRVAASAGMQDAVICGADGPQTIRLDATGAPAQPANDCCDCLDCLGPVAFVAPEGPACDAAPSPSHAAVWPATRTLVPSPTRLLPMTRGPPLVPGTTEPRRTAANTGWMVPNAPGLLEFRQGTRGHLVTSRRRTSEFAR